MLVCLRYYFLECSWDEIADEIIVQNRTCSIVEYGTIDYVFRLY